jgi:hypothetical protein
MQTKLAVLSLVLATMAVPAVADHNSRWGEGWARMPNDVHNTRVETRGDNTAFRDFVRYGEGADSENRFTTDESRKQDRRAIKSSRSHSASANTKRRGR